MGNNCSGKSKATSTPARKTRESIKRPKSNSEHSSGLNCAPDSDLKHSHSNVVKGVKKAGFVEDVELQMGFPEAQTSYKSKPALAGYEDEYVYRNSRIKSSHSSDSSEDSD